MSKQTVTGLCACSKPASRILDGDGVCERCYDIDRAKPARDRKRTRKTAGVRTNDEAMFNAGINAFFKERGLPMSPVSSCSVSSWTRGRGLEE